MRFSLAVRLVSAIGSAIDEGGRPHQSWKMQALFIGQTYIDVTFLTDRMPTGDEKHVASGYAVSFVGTR